MKYLFTLSLCILIGACSSNPVTPDEEIRNLHINYEITYETHVHLWIENAYQTKVKTLVDEIQPSGYYSLPFKMTDEEGNPLPYGLYVYYIETDSLSHHNTMLYLE